MEDHSARIFADVDALLEQTTAQLPRPEQCRQLRTDAGLTTSQVARALHVEPALVEAWEAGLLDPTGLRRTAYARLIDGLTQRQSAPPQPTAPSAVLPPAPAQPRAAAPFPTPTGQIPPAAGPGRAPAAVPPARGSGRGRPAAGPADETFPAGPVAVLDTDGHELTAHLAAGTRMACPADTLTDLGHWALNTGLGQPRLSINGSPSDPLIVLTPSASAYLGLPAELLDRAALRLPADHPQITALHNSGWSLTRTGFGPWARIYLPVQGGRRRSIQLAVTAWGALSDGGWDGAPVHAGPAALARWLGLYAQRVLTPRGSTAVCGQELMTAMRPPTKAVKDPVSNRWVAGPNQGSLWEPLDPAPPEAHPAHPLARDRATGDALEEEAYNWHRLPDEAELRHYPLVVGVDINLAFLAAANSVIVGLNAPPQHITTPRFEKKTPGCWYVDLCHVPIDPRLPSPFTATGQPPVGPAWYATPTVAYAQELGATIRPQAAWIRADSGRYFDPWYKRLRDAYLATMRDLGVTADMTPTTYLAAMERLPHKDPATLGLLAAIKATAKGGIGKLRAGPREAAAPFSRWPALDTPTWRPDIRAAIISLARVNLHRKMTKAAQLTGRYPLAVLTDCVVYPATAPTAMNVVPHAEDGTSLPGTFRLGVTPGYAKQEGAQTMDWLADLARTGDNAARTIKAPAPQAPNTP